MTAVKYKAPIHGLVGHAGKFPALRAAADNGADAVYTGFHDGTNARSFSGLNQAAKAAYSGERDRSFR